MSPWICYTCRKFLHVKNTHIKKPEQGITGRDFYAYPASEETDPERK
jgi:hypothetical protein